MKNIKLRKIKKSDLPYFLKWWQDKILIGLTSGIYESSGDVLRSYFFEMLRKKDNQYYAILCNNKIIGDISIIKKSQDMFELQIVIGEKEYWGKGIGKIAIDRLLKIAFTRMGYKKAYLEVRPDNSRAIGLYKNCGFMEAGIRKDKENKYQPVVLKMTLSKKTWQERKVK